MITGAIASFIMAWLPTLALGAGPLGILAGIATRFRPGLTLRLVAVAALGVAIAGASVHYMNLRADSAELGLLKPRIAGLERSLGCTARPEHERELFACLPARDRDAEEARAHALREQQTASARARDALESRKREIEAEQAEEWRRIEDASSADDGPLPKVLRDTFARERARRGIK